MKILAAVPEFGGIKPECLCSLYTMTVPEGVSLDIYVSKGHSSAIARNGTAVRALKRDYDAVFLLDGDQIVPADALLKLLAIDAPVSAGWSMMRVGDNRSNIVSYDREKDVYSFYPVDDIPKGVISVDAVGGACYLIKTFVFNAIAFPYFVFAEYPDRSQMSEDLYFCKQCREANIEMKVDTSLKIGHIKTVVI